MRALAGTSLALCLAVASVSQADIPDYCYQYADDDQDGYVYGALGLTCPRDDCNDEDPSIHPGATEICGDGIDQDCDGHDMSCAGVDDDHDGFRAIAAGGDDCDDQDPSVHPGQPEICGDGKDNDCADGDLPCRRDDDNDGYGALADGGLDCDDQDPSVHPHALEICGDGVDQDCAGGDPACADDIDGDGFRNPSAGGDDCDDFDAATHPGADDPCGDGRDQDCDGIDPACDDRSDADGDGHATYAAGGDDCDDSRADVYPGAHEVCDDGLDQDCDGRDLSCSAASGDADGDGHKNLEAGGDDCHDRNAAIYPGAPEICGDGVDQDCDGSDTPLGSAACDSGETSNPAFAALREQSPARGTGTADGCRQLGSLPSALWLVGLSLLLRRRRR